MEKILRLTINRLGFVLIISAVFLSIPQQEFHSNYNIPVACSETLPATYPNLTFSTYLGGENSGENGHSVAVTDDGSFYITGQTGSNDFPTQHAYNSTYSGNSDAVVAKFNTSGSLIWSTYFGGSNLDFSNDNAVTSDGSCYIVGFTESADFPTQNAYNNTFSGKEDTFLAKFAANGSLLWSTYFGGNGNDWPCGIAVANDGSSYVMGWTDSRNFPTKNAYADSFNGGNFDLFVAKFATNGSLLWSTYFGGDGNDVGYSNNIAVTGDGSCYVSGLTTSDDFPTQNAYDTTSNGYWDVFVTKFNASGSLLWSTYFGGTWWDETCGIVAANDESCYITGFTTSPDFPTQHAYNNTNGGWGDVFVSKFTLNGSLLWSTFLGGNGGDRGYDIAVAHDGSCYVTGETSSTNFPVKHAYIESKNSGFDAFVTKFSSEGFLHWSTYLGGERTDKGYGVATTDDGHCYVVGTTHSPDFPTQYAFDNTLGSTCDIFIVKFIDTPLPSSSHRAYYGFLAFIVFIPIVVLIYYKKRK